MPRYIPRTGVNRQMARMIRYNPISIVTEFLKEIILFFDSGRLQTDLEKDPHWTEKGSPLKQTACNPSLGLVLGVAETGKEGVETGQEYTNGLLQQWPGSETEKPGAPILDQCLGQELQMPQCRETSASEPPSVC